jgi:thymidylate synthase
MQQYLDLVKHVIGNGTRKENRTGVDTISTFGYYFEHDLQYGFPMLTTKAVSWKNIVVEMLWFLSGQTDISILKRHGCKFWDAWADENGKVPSAYGNFWRQFPVHKEQLVEDSNQFGDIIGPPLTHRELAFNDQIAWVLAELRRNPMSRRMVVSAWAPGNAQMSKLPPCHCLFMFNVQNEDMIEHHPPKENDDGRTLVPTLMGTKQRLCLHLTQRSCDVALGVPYNIASYALLLSLFSHFTGIEPGIFGHSLVDAHIYTAKPDGSKAEFDHLPGLKQQLTRNPFQLPRLKISDEIRSLEDIERLMDPSVTTDEIMRHFVLNGYDPHPAINFKVAV